MLRLLYPLFAAGLGGPLGDGTGWQPWIEIDDLLDVYLRAVTDPALAGPVNAVAPAAVQSAQYATTLGRVLHRPSLVPVPPAGPRLLLGARAPGESRQPASGSARWRWNPIRLRHQSGTRAGPNEDVTRRGRIG